MDQPITERSNNATRSIDVASSQEIISLLEKCDAEIFNGWGGSKGLLHPSVADVVTSVAAVAAEILQVPNCQKRIILSGCGTSGRLAFLVSKTLNEKLEKHGWASPCCDYIIAGGDKSLFKSQDAAEDDPFLGAKCLEEACVGVNTVLYVGITCGFSAPFIAGQLDYCMQYLDKYTPVLFGFNPICLARNTKIANWDKTFLDVARHLEEVSVEGKGFILNPCIGPEAICGSSRMKGATATKILLEVIFIMAHMKTFLPDKFVCPSVLLNHYSHIIKDVYRNHNVLADIVDMAGHCLKSGGHIYYLGWGSLGIMGIIDASECPPTYGASFDDVRGFVSGGYSSLKNKEGSQRKGLHISTEDFQVELVPNLKKGDIVIALLEDTESVLPTWLSKLPCKLVSIRFSAFPTEKQSSSVWTWQQGNTSTCVFNLSLEDLGIDIQGDWNLVYLQLASKLVCNAITTGAHIQKGKVFQNFMVDMKVSNSKLFLRAAGIIQKLSGLTEDESTKYLLRSIYKTDILSEQQMRAPLAQHIDAADCQQKIVPAALIAAILKSSVVDAKKKLETEPIIRNAIMSIMEKQNLSGKHSLTTPYHHEFQ